MERICIVAIAKDELPFIDEWLAYHRIIGIDHVFLYDDEEGAPLFKHLKENDFVTVIPWFKQRLLHTKVRNQVRAYSHAIQNHIQHFDWVSFLDIDEFFVFRNCDNIKIFLEGFADVASISLNWHVFGHNGYYDDPEGLILPKLTRRMHPPSQNVKSITRVHLIEKVGQHHCKLISGKRVDGNNRKFNNDLYDGKTDVAHVNHYQCRSFSRWMKRADRGDVNFHHYNSPPEHQWRLTKEGCLKQFVTTVALNKNEHIDCYMQKFESQLSAYLFNEVHSK